MKKILAILATPIAGLLIAATPAFGHTPLVQPSCGGLGVRLDNYEPGNGQNNLVIISIDNQPPGGVFFGASYGQMFSWSQTAVHSYSVQIDANRQSGNPTQYDAVFTGTWQPCQSAPTTTTTPATTSTAPTTTVPATTPPCAGGGAEPCATTTVPAIVTVPENPCSATPAPEGCNPPAPTDPLATVAVFTHGDTLPVTGSQGAWFTFGLALILVGSGAIAALVTRRRA